ncbi:MAG: hypothetical protein J5789_04375 [Oscillospiraceae bacterium]|nr:hypothetical protein [Oscillospiraceae bacterium]
MIISNFLKLHSTPKSFRKFKLIALAAIASLLVFLLAACDQTDEESLEAQDFANLRSAYAEAKMNYEAGKQDTTSREVEVYQKKAGWNKYLNAIPPELQDAAKKLSQLTSDCKYTIEVIVNEDNTLQAVLHVID